MRPYRLSLLAIACTAATALSGGCCGTIPPRSATERPPQITEAQALQWRPAPPSIPPGARIALLEGDPAKPGPFTLRLFFPAGYRIPPHRHPAPEHATVISGALHIATGETFGTSGGWVVPAGGFLLMPAGTAHFGWVGEDTVLQLHGQGPWQLQ